MEQCVEECKNHNSYSYTLSYIIFFQFLIGTAHYLSVGGGGGHVNNLVASRGSPLNLASQQG